MAGAAIYARISNDQTGLKAGVTQQVEDCRSLVKRRGLRLVREPLIDNDMSATSGKRRPAFHELLRLVDEGSVDTIVVWHTDRLYRLFRDLMPLLELAKNRRVEFLTVTAGDLDLGTPSGRAFASMLATNSTYEVEHKSERQKAANLQRMKQGKRIGGSRRQFGYAKDGVTLVEPEAAAIRDGYSAVLAGVPLAAVSRDWNARGLLSTQKRQARSGHAGEPSPWRPDSVRSVLSNPRNAGIVTYQGEEQRTVDTGNGGVRELVAEWPAIVDEATFRAVVSILRDPARRSGARGSGRYLLSGLAKCGVQGCEGHAHAGGNARAGVPGYRCSASMGHFARMATPVEEFVSSVIVARLARKDARDLLVKPGPDAKVLRREVLALDRRIEDLAGLVGDGTFTPAQARSAADRLKTQRAAIESQIADAGRVDVLGPLVAAHDVRAAWDGLDVDRKRAVIDTLMTVTVHPVGRGTRTFRPETVGIDWKTD